MAQDRNITMWFNDAAIRHPDIRHTDAVPRFFELEWDELVSNAKSLSAKSPVLILEDYVDGLNDNGGDYITHVLKLAFMVVQFAKPGDRAGKKQVYLNTRRIAEGILGKMRKDSEECGDNDNLPGGIVPPVKVLYNTVQGTKVGPVPYFESAYGYRIMVDVRFEEPEEFIEPEVAWLPII